MKASLYSRRDVLGLLGSGLAFLSGCEDLERKPGVAIVGSSPTGVPFSFIDPWTNDLTGSMIDIARAVTERATLSIELRVTPFSALIPSLLARKIDMIAAALLRTSEREKVVAFSDPVFAYGGGLVVAEGDTHPYPNLQALQSLSVGVQVGTRFVEQVRAAGISEIRTYDNLADMVRDLRHGRIQAVYGDAPILTYQLRVGGRRGVRLATEFQAPAREELCFVLRKDDPTLSSINHAIASLRASRIPTIIRHWGLD